MERFRFIIAACLIVILLACCSGSDRKAKSTLKGAVLNAARTEVSSMISIIRTCQTTYRAERGVYRECLPSPPGGGTDVVPDVWVDAGGFEDIGFRPSGRVRYQYAVTVSADGNSYEITATGDLDENGVKAVHTATNSNPKARKQPPGEY